MNENLKALREVLSPKKNEKWGDYLIRAQSLGLVTIKETLAIAKEYGRTALDKKVE